MSTFHHDATTGSAESVTLQVSTLESSAKTLTIDKGKDVDQHPFSLKNIPVTERTSFLDPEKSKAEEAANESTRCKWIAWTVGALLAVAAISGSIVAGLKASQSQPPQSFIATSYQPKTVVYNWVVSNFSQNIDGVVRHAIGINGARCMLSKIVATRGDRIILHLTNNLNVPTSIHFHGLLQRGTPWMDGPAGITQCSIAPNQTYIYNFTVSDVSGTFFWHGHYRLQYVDGFSGPLVILDPQDRTIYDYTNDQTLMLSDWYHKQSETLISNYLNGETNPDGNEPIWDTGLMNGLGSFNCSADPETVCMADYNKGYIQSVFPGKTIRLRICNSASFAAFLFSIDGHPLTVIEVDGVSVQPYTVDSVSINIAQRYSVLITANQTAGNYYIRANMYHGDPWTSAPIMPAGMNPELKGILNYWGVATDKEPAAVTTLENPTLLDDMKLEPMEVQHPPPNTQKDLTVLFEFEFAKYHNDTFQKSYPSVSILNQEKERWDTMFTNSFVSIVNESMLVQAHDLGPQWKPHPESNTVMVEYGQVVDIIIRNDDGGEHPMHLHGHTFWVMATGVANSLSNIPREFNNPNPLRRDVVSVVACPHNDEGCLPANVTDFPEYVPPLSKNITGYPYFADVDDEEGNWFGYA
ncbi:UNVERIFIED_CONTAM: hypothetical protein HDU68_005380, partial [Siphonaria sp. JEL0065]